MAIYLGLIGYILVLSVGVKFGIKDRIKQKNTILFWGILAIFLLLALKKYTVGIDTVGYMEQYLLSREKAWLDVDYVYFESGYITLMKLFSKLGISYQWFSAAMYAIICVPMYFFLRKHSSDVTLSLLVFICYQFLVFDLSGLRQAIATGICLIAFLVLERGGKWNLLVSVLIVWLASTIHQSALIFYSVIFLSLISSPRVRPLYYVIGFVLAFVLRPYVWSFIDTFIRNVGTGGEVTLAGNFVFLLGMTGFLFITAFPPKGLLTAEKSFSRVENTSFELLTLRVLLTSIIAHVLFSGHTMLRATMYLTLFFLPGISNALQHYKFYQRVFIKYIFAVFLIALFYFETLAPNQLQICPYLFFWQ